MHIPLYLTTQMQEPRVQLVRVRASLPANNVLSILALCLRVYD